jgi:hypothetical protein
VVRYHSDAAYRRRTLDLEALAWARIVVLFAEPTKFEAESAAKATHTWVAPDGP